MNINDHDALAEECRAITAAVEAKWPTAAHRSKIDAVTMKLAEEVGELIGAVVKHEQGRTDKDWLDEARQELGDVMIVLAQVSTMLTDLANRTNKPSYGRAFGLVQAMRNRWHSVSRRKGTAVVVDDDGQGTLPEAWLPQPPPAAGASAVKIVPVGEAVHKAAAAAAAREPDLLQVLSDSVKRVRGHEIISVTIDEPYTAAHAEQAIAERMRHGDATGPGHA